MNFLKLIGWKYVINIMFNTHTYIIKNSVYNILLNKHNRWIFQFMIH